MTSGPMHAQVLHEWGGEVRYETVARPSVVAGEVLLEVEACSVGLTALNYMSGNHSRRPEDLPRIPGHEIVGRVIATGDGVSSPRVGERVLTHFYLFCGACDLCHLGHEPLCRNLAGQVGVARDGGYAEYVALPARNCIAVPDGVSPIAATAIPDAIATPLHVSRRAAIWWRVSWRFWDRATRRAGSSARRPAWWRSGASRRSSPRSFRCPRWAHSTRSFAAVGSWGGAPSFPPAKPLTRWPSPDYS